MHLEFEHAAWLETQRRARSKHLRICAWRIGGEQSRRHIVGALRTKSRCSLWNTRDVGIQLEQRDARRVWLGFVPDQYVMHDIPAAWAHFYRLHPLRFREVRRNVEVFVLNDVVGGDVIVLGHFEY